VCVSASKYFRPLFQKITWDHTITGPVQPPGQENFRVGPVSERDRALLRGFPRIEVSRRVPPLVAVGTSIYVCSGESRDGSSSLLSRVGETENTVHVSSDLLVQLREQLAIPVKGHVDGRVTHAPLDRLRVSALGDCQRDLRHTAGTLAARTGATTKELMSRFGHSSPRASMIYQHAAADRDRLIAEGLDKMTIEAGLAPIVLIGEGREMAKRGGTGA